MNFLFEETCIIFRANVLRVLVAITTQLISLGFIILLFVVDVAMKLNSNHKNNLLHIKTHIKM